MSTALGAAWIGAKAIVLPVVVVVAVVIVCRVLAWIVKAKRGY